MRVQSADPRVPEDRQDHGDAPSVAGQDDHSGGLKCSCCNHTCSPSLLEQVRIQMRQQGFFPKPESQQSQAPPSPSQDLSVDDLFQRLTLRSPRRETRDDGGHQGNEQSQMQETAPSFNDIDGNYQEKQQSHEHRTTKPLITINETPSITIDEVDDKDHERKGEKQDLGESNILTPPSTEIGKGKDRALKKPSQVSVERQREFALLVWYLR